MNHAELENAPYCWSMIERELGLLDSERKPKLAAHALKEAGEMIASLPFDEMPKRKKNTVILLTAEQNHWDCGAPAYVTAKKAGLEVVFANLDTPLPDAENYIVPCITGWSVMDKAHQDSLFRRVSDGATVLVSYNGGQFARFEEFFGLRSHGIVASKRTHTASFTFGEYNYHADQEILPETIGAPVSIKQLIDYSSPLFRTF